MAKFEPESYRRFRIGYPAALFESLKPYCRSSDLPLPILDLGAGTGFSSQSFAQVFPECQMTLIEPDLEMLKVAELSAGEFKYPPHFIQAKAEEPLSQSFQGALIGSAWHWMDATQVMAHLATAINPGGFVFIFEYQFPKGLGEAGKLLNDWVRREFNLLWKPLHQKPRGTLVELTECFRLSNEFSERKRIEFSVERICDESEFSGLIFSQSRFLDYERRLNLDEQRAERLRVQAKVAEFFSLQSEFRLSYSFSGLIFERRVI